MLLHNASPSARPFQKLLLATVYCAILTASSNASYIKRATNSSTVFDYGTQKVKGVNIGGWLVTEPWITPSLFEVGDPEVVDEYTLCKSLGRDKATQRLRAHWDSLYTEEDFHAIKSYGLNHVRIPIGYWAFDISDGEPYVQGQWEYLIKAIGWCRDVGLRVLIDLHGAPGSQNGADNSGRRGPIGWDENEKNVERTKAVLVNMTNEFAKPEYAQVVAGIQPLNEPRGKKSAHMLQTVKEFYKDGYDIVRRSGKHSGDGPPTQLLYTIHDASQAMSAWANFFPSPEYRSVSLDAHLYTIFTDKGIKMTDEERMADYCKKIPTLTASQANIWTFVAEFTPAPTDCAPLLNGIGKGALYDGTLDNSTKVGDCSSKTGLASSFSEKYKESLGKFFEIQTHVYEHGSGWFMWTFKAEKADDWSYDAGVKGGWIPKNIDEKKYGVHC